MQVDFFFDLLDSDNFGFVQNLQIHFGPLLVHFPVLHECSHLGGRLNFGLIIKRFFIEFFVDFFECFLDIQSAL